MTLHILLTHHRDVAQQCLQSLVNGDALVLLNDGVYAGLASGALSETIAMLPAEISVLAIADDCRARGVHARLHSRIAQIDYPAFVALSCTHPRSVSWF